MLDLPLLAGAISSAMFVLGTLPMVYKAFATKSLKSYSMSSLLFNNLGNLIHALYVYSLPPGPIWLLHTFHLITTALMLFWYMRYEDLPKHRMAQKFNLRFLKEHSFLLTKVQGNY
jgi:uncharacterized protein with PQ loop repeat